jgi:hypothetical protein
MELEDGVDLKSLSLRSHDRAPDKNVLPSIEIAPYLDLHRRESCIRQGAKEGDVMVLPMDMCDYDAHSGNIRICNVCSGSLLAEFSPVRVSSRDTY